MWSTAVWNHHCLGQHLVDTRQPTVQQPTSWASEGFLRKYKLFLQAVYTYICCYYCYLLLKFYHYLSFLIFIYYYLIITIIIIHCCYLLLVILMYCYLLKCVVIISIITIIRRKFRSQTSRQYGQMKSRDGKGQRREEEEKRREEKEKEDQRRASQKKEDAGARKGRKVAKHCVFPMLCGSGGSKSRLAKAAGAEQSGQMRDEKLHTVVAWTTFRSQMQKHLSFGALLEVEMSKKCTPLWREAHLQVKKLKTPHVRSTFGSWDVEKVHAVVARSTFRSQHVKNTRGSDHFWRFRCRKSARRCGAKHISKSNV